MKHHSKISPPKPGQDARLDQSVLSRIAALKAMSVKELKTEWERLLGSAAPNNSRAFLEARRATATPGPATAACKRLHR